MAKGAFGLGHPHEIPPGDDEADALGGYPDGEVNCKHCGKGPFTWLHTGVRWRLVDERSRFHQCAGKPATTDDFE